MFLLFSVCIHSVYFSIFLSRHGDMLFLFPSSAGSSSENMDTAQPHSSSSLSSSSSSSMSRSHSGPQIQEDEIDQYLAKQDGKIYRNRDPQLWAYIYIYII